MKNDIILSGVGGQGILSIAAVIGLAAIDGIIKEIKKIKNHMIIDADKIAKEVGSYRYGNIVILGAASPFINIPFESLEIAIKKIFAYKGEGIVEGNLKALRAGRDFSDYQGKK